MRGYIKTVIIMAVIFLLGILLLILKTKDLGAAADRNSREHVLLLNKIAGCATEKADDLKELEKDGFHSDYVIVDTTDNILYSHIEKANAPDNISVEYAIQKRYPYMYLKKDDKIWGAVILLDDVTDEIRSFRDRFILGAGVCCFLILTACIGYGLYIRRTVILPFRNLKDFAGSVAEGKLDAPLEMDRGNMFGAFSESFDIMREELAESKRRELELQKKEKELVASLSHDLKTPVTGIKVTTEFLEMRLSSKIDTKEEKIFFDREEIVDMLEDTTGIRQKTEQIDTLVSDLFTSTLDDLGEFKVFPGDEESSVLADIVRSYDTKGCVRMGEIPAVVIHIDRKRMGQVIGNVIANSYKYADTDIDIAYELAEGYLEMQIKDHGPGVPRSELDLITNKFYRGKDWENSGKDGNGLGLYIARSLMKKMDGDLIAESDEDGLMIRLVIRLS